MVTKITESRYSEARSTYEGWCVECCDFTRDRTEPDANDYDCPVCEENTVIGAENLLWSDEIVVIPDDAPPGGGILMGKVLEESITAAMMSRVLSVETGERLLGIHGAVCHDIWCGGCDRILDTWKSVLVTPKGGPLRMGSFVRCGDCFDSPKSRFHDLGAGFIVTDFRDYGPDFRLKGAAS
jgi:hypothetical protein